MIKRYILGLASGRTIYKVSMIVLCLSFLIIQYLIAIFNYQGTPFDETPANIRAGNVLSFFGFQVNIIILIYFFNSLLFYRNEGLTRGTSSTFKIAVATYASFVLVVYGLILFPGMLVKHPFNLRVGHGTAMTIQNGLVPLLAITYIIIISYDEHIYTKQFFGGKLWLLLIYPSSYLIFILVRGKLRLLDNIRDPSLFGNALGEINGILIYNYPFFSYDQKVSFINLDGALTFVFFITFFIVLLLSLVGIYVFVFNKRYAMKHHQSRKVLRKK